MIELDVSGAKEALRSIVEEVAFSVASLPLEARDRCLQKKRKNFEICFQIGGVDPAYDAGARRTIELVMSGIYALLKEIDRSSAYKAS
ncbi:hypothetical protein [Bradyrhizobium genosp. P]|uniref:hypothetical protein n=1 Tax=Bradyrhizobium genosp. P TaxID=83641 RepID=UPI003CEAFCD8